MVIREHDRCGAVWAAVADGSSVAHVASRLFLSEGTFRNYLSTAIQKTGARNRLKTIRMAEKSGWLCAVTLRAGMDHAWTGRCRSAQRVICSSAGSRARPAPVSA